MVSSTFATQRRAYGIVRRRVLVIGATVLMAGGAMAEAQTGANVLVVINTDSAASGTIGRQYAAKRDVPQENICEIAEERFGRVGHEGVIAGDGKKRNPLERVPFGRDRPKDKTALYFKSVEPVCLRQPVPTYRNRLLSDPR